MKIGLAQIQSEGSQFSTNLEKHLFFIHKASSKGVDLVIFPELSLSAYEPDLAKGFVQEYSDTYYSIFQDLSSKLGITIILGAPTQKDNSICISNLIFLPHQPARIYSKQMLHQDEEPYFCPGQESNIVEIGNYRIGLAICYESTQDVHFNSSIKKGIDLYLVNVVKHQEGMGRAVAIMQKRALEHSLPILLCNASGFYDGFKSSGQSAVWDENGLLKGSLLENEGLLVYDLDSGYIQSH